MGEFKAGTAGLIAGPRFDVGQDANALAVFRARLTHSGAKQLLDYWAGLVSQHGTAIKHLIDPSAIPRLLPSIYLEEWDESAGQSRIRLAGEAIRNLSGDRIVGLSVDEYADRAVANLWKECDRINFQDRAPSLSHYNLARFLNDRRWVWDLSLPLSDTAGKRFVIGYVWTEDLDTDISA